MQRNKVSFIQVWLTPSEKKQLIDNGHIVKKLSEDACLQLLVAGKENRNLYEVSVSGGIYYLY